MKYQFQEGSLEFNSNYQDETVHVIRLTEPQSTIVITREPIKQGQTLKKYTENQMAVLKKSMKKFLAEQSQEIQLAGGDLNGYETVCQFEKNGVKLFQRMVIFQQQQQIIVINYTLLRKFTPDDIAFWEKVKQSYQPTIMLS